MCSEKSWPWAEAGPGDGVAYTDEEWRNMWRAVFGTEGILRSYGNELAVTVAGANNLEIDTGAAFVDGNYYQNITAHVHIAPTSAPAGETRKCAVIIAQNHTTQEVRVAFKVGTAGAYPTPTHTPGTLWEMLHWYYIINDAGAITLGAQVSSYAVFHDALPVAATSVFLKGMILAFSGTFTGDVPNDVDTGNPDTKWHVCNGGTANGVTTPDLRDKFVISSGPTYAAGTTGGAATKNLAHTHAAGTLAVAAHSAHTHVVDLIAALSSAANYIVDLGAATFCRDPNHTHDVHGSTNYATLSAHVVSGASGSAGSATQDVMPPYYALAYVCYVGV